MQGRLSGKREIIMNYKIALIKGDGIWSMKIVDEAVKGAGSGTV